MIKPAVSPIIHAQLFNVKLGLHQKVKNSIIDLINKLDFIINLGVKKNVI